jgi:hypothetical protein
MPIDAKLRILDGGVAVEHLMEYSALRAGLATATSYEGLLSIAIDPLLLLEDIYGRVSKQEASDCSLWEGKADQPVLCEADFGDVENVGYVGEWNLSFIRWLRGISLETGEAIDVAYEHERGDYLYEQAWWASDPSSTEGVIEVFGVQSHEDSDEPWCAEVMRHSDGRVTVRKC